MIRGCRRTRSLALVAAGLAAAQTVLLATALPARAGTDTAAALPLSTVQDVLVDDAHGHVFVTGGATDGIVVRTLDGAAVTTITNEPGAAKMALSNDGSRLYVGLSAGDAVSAIDTTTLTEVARYATGASTCPGSVADVGGKLWFGYSCAAAGSNLGVIDPSTTPATVTLDRVPANTFSGLPWLQAVPGTPGLLAAGDIAQSWGSLTLVDVSSGSAVLGATRSFANPLNDLAVTADGTHVLTASPDSSLVQAFKTTDLSADGVYGSANQDPVAVAAGPGGLVVGANWSARPAVNVSRPDASLVRTYDFGDCTYGGSCLPIASGAAFTADGSRLYVLTTDWYGGTVTLHVLHDAGKAPSTLTLAKPSTAAINHAFALSGRLTSTLAVPGGQTVTLRRSSSYGTVALPSATTAADGTFSVPDQVAQRGTYTYTASWPGDATHAPASVSVAVPVSGLATALTITTSAGPWSYGAKPLVVAHLGTTTLRTVTLYATPYGGSRTLLKTGAVDSHGNLSAAYTITRRTAFTAVFAGDDTYQPATSTKALLSRVRMVWSLSGSYGTSSGYHLVHAGIAPRLTVSVSPNNHKACEAFLLQQYVSGAWHTVDTSSCVALDTYSRAWVVIGGSHPAGSRYRLRPSFVGSTQNAATPGGFVYVRFTT